MTNCLTGLSPLFNILEIKRVLHAVEGAETNRLKRKIRSASATTVSWILGERGSTELTFFDTFIIQKNPA
jgi:hypothetical protein